MAKAAASNNIIRMTDILTKPEWFPYYVQRMKGSKAWKELKDFQFAWYWKLLTELADSDTPGYLPNDVGVLWNLAGAQTEVFFRTRGGLELLARHFNRTADGLRIYNERMLNVLHEQGNKRARKKRRTSGTLSSLVSIVERLPEWIPKEEFGQFMHMREKIRKPLTEHAVKLLVGKLEHLRENGDDPKRVLQESIVNNWQSVFPLRREENGNGRPYMARDTSGTNGGTPAARSFAQENCGTCGGSGWDTSSGKASRCGCFQKNRQANAAGAPAGGQRIPTPQTC